MGPTTLWDSLECKDLAWRERQRHKTKVTPFVKSKGLNITKRGNFGCTFKFKFGVDGELH